MTTEYRQYNVLKYLNQNHIRKNQNLDDKLLKEQFEFTEHDFKEALDNLLFLKYVERRENSCLKITQDGEVKFNEWHEKFSKDNKVKSEEPIKTYCCYCQKETNQEVLFKDNELGTQEIVWRNDHGDENQSAWAVVANIWTLSKCMGCEKINFKHVFRSSPDKETDRTFYFPRRPIRDVPSWIIKLPIIYLEILQEVYTSVNEELYILSLTGIRILLDVFIVNKIGDAGTFKQKLDKLVTDGVITSSKSKVLEATIEAGNASAHRGYKPDKDTLFQILDIVENLLQSEIVDRPLNQIKQKTPPRTK